MLDSEVVAAMVADDPRGLEHAYTRHADRLHDYCAGMLGDTHAAADVVHDTFLVARERIGQLRDAQALRPWLYAIARSGCLRALRSRRRLRPLDDTNDERPDGGDVDMDTGLRQDELRDLVRAALGGLNPREREVVDLILRHDLSIAELAATLRVPTKQAHALASTARTQLERCLAVLLVARTGRDSCSELSAMLAHWDGTLTPLWRKRIHRHLEQCATCAAERQRRVRPEALLGLLPLIAAPVWLYRQVRADAFDPGLVAYRTQLAKQSGPYGSGGFPGQRRRGTTEARTAAIAAVAALFITGALATPALVDGLDRAGRSDAAARAPAGAVPRGPQDSPPAPSASASAAAPAASPSASASSSGPSAGSSQPGRTGARAPAPRPPGSNGGGSTEGGGGPDTTGPGPTDPDPEPEGEPVTGVTARAIDASETCARTWTARVTAVVAGGPAETVTVEWTTGQTSGSRSMDGRGSTWTVDVDGLAPGAFRYSVTAVGEHGGQATSEAGGLIHQGCTRER